jgi:hypothetical protein
MSRIWPPAAPKKVGWGAEPRSDLHDDPLPEVAIARLGSSQFLHEDWIRNLAIFPVGNPPRCFRHWVNLAETKVVCEVPKIVC